MALKTNYIEAGGNEWPWYPLSNLLAGLLMLANGVQAQLSTPAPFRVEQGQTRRLSGNHVFSHMVINGTLLIEGDTTVTLLGPAIVEDGVPPGQVFFVKYTGKIENELHHGVLGASGADNPITKGPSGTSGRNSNPDNRSDPPGNGTDGGRGYDGNDGQSGGGGWSAPTFVVQALGGGVQISGSISLNGANGNQGGKGSNATEGGRGGNGGSSQYLTGGSGGVGGPGGNGGFGARGGHGGHGGTFKLVAHGPVFLLGNISASAGNGGRGGSAGKGGAGGAGGDAGNYPKTYGPANGSPGRGGDAGASGWPGSGGDGGQGGTIDIYATGDIYYYTVRSLTANGGNGGNRGGGGGGGGSGGSGGSYIDGVSASLRGPCGLGVNDLDGFGNAGHAGDGGRIRIATRGSLKPYVEGQNCQLQLIARGGDGARHERGHDVARSHCEWMTPNDGILKGGTGGRGGEVEVQAKGSAQLKATLTGGAGNFGAYGQGIEGVAGADGAPGGDGGPGGFIQVTSPVITINPATDLNLEGGTAGQGGFPGGYPGSGPYGQAGPAGQPGISGKHKLVLADPALFPKTSELLVVSKPSDKAPVGKIVRYQYRFTNDDPEFLLKNLKLLATWDSPYVEPVECDLGGVPQGRGFAAFPADLAPGQVLTWTLSAKILPPFHKDIVIGCNVEIHGEIVNSTGDDFAILPLPMAPQEGLWFDIVPDRFCVLPGSELPCQVRWENTNTEDPFSKVVIRLADLPPGVSLASGLSSWNVGTLAPGASGSADFKVQAANPWLDAWGEKFALDGSAVAAELDGTLILDSIHDVWVGELGLDVASPAAPIEYRGNRVGSTGTASACIGNLEPGDVALFFTTQGVDADTGIPLSLENAPVPVSASFTFDTDDAARLVAIQNTLTAFAEAKGNEATDGPFSALSAFYRLVHELYESSLPRLELLGLPNSGQQTKLDFWKVDYPDIDEALACRQTDAVERLDVINDIGIIAKIIADQHYPEILEGTEGIISVWDLAFLFTAGIEKRLIKYNRVLGAVLGGTTGRIAATTSRACDMLANSVMPGIGKKLGADGILSSYLQGEAMNALLARFDDNIVDQIARTAQWQLCSGKTLSLVLRNVTSGGTIPCDAEVDGLMEVLLRLIFEGPIHEAVAYGQEHALDLSFSGSQDLALLSGENAKQVLQSLSYIALGWGDVYDAGHDIASALCDSLMWIELIPIGPLQQAAHYSSYVADALSRVGATAKAIEHVRFLLRVSTITAAGISSVIEGNLDSFGYPVPASASTKALRPLGPTPTETILQQYLKIDTAAHTVNADALADAAESLAPLYEQATARENLLAVQAEVLINPPPNVFPDPKIPTSAAIDYQYAAQSIAPYRMALLRQMLALAAQPDTTVQANLLATLTRLHAGETELAVLEQNLHLLLAGFTLPDLPVLTCINAPLASETGSNLVISVTLANTGSGNSARGRIALVIPDELQGGLLSPASQEFSTVNGTARVEWTLRPTRPGTYTENFTIQLYGADGRPLDSHTLMLSVDEAGAQLTLGNGEPGTLNSALGSAQLDVPKRSFTGTAGQPGRLGQENIVVHLMPISSAVMGPGFIRIGDAVFVIAAFHSGTAQPASIVGPAPVLTLRWNESDVPNFVSAAQLRIFMAESGQRWTALDSVVNVDARTVRAAIPRTGSFAIGWLDPEPPAAIKGLRAAIDEDQVALEWLKASEIDVASYQLLARDELGAPVVTAYTIMNPDTVHFTAVQHPKGGTRYYTVRALDMAGNLGPESAPIAVKRPGSGNGDAVVLSIRIENGAVVFSWPAEAEGCLLESSPRLPAAHWSLFPLNPVIIEGRYTVSSPVSPNARFFRLRKP